MQISMPNPSHSINSIPKDLAVPASLKTLYRSDTLKQRIAELGAQITEDYQGKDLVLIAILKGSFPFLADLCRAIPLPLSIEFLGLSSYGSNTETTGVVRITQDLSNPIDGKDVLIVEDIVDTGLTLRYIEENFQTRNPRSIEVCTLLDKPSGRKIDVEARYVGFRIENHFVVGFGLDLDQKYRNLPYIGYFDPPEAACTP
jgi:hypoxanthine phosphoribosyltransferase